MKKFSEMGIKPDTQSFVGNKIDVNYILNVEIIVHKYKLVDSKFGGGKKCLHLQITYNNEKRVVFHPSVNLAQTIEQVAPEDFPFTTTIIRDQDKRLYFK